MGQWISQDKDCENVVISVLCRGITMLNQNDKFSNISNMHRTVSTENNNAFLTTNVTSPTSPPTILAAPIEANPKRKGRTGTTASKLFVERIRGRTISGFSANSSLVQTSDSNSVAAANNINGATAANIKEATHGLSTFAALSAGLAIQASAEICISQISNHLGNFPPLGETTGVSSLSSIWSEESSTINLLKRKFIRSKLSGLSSVKQDHLGKVGLDKMDFVGYENLFNEFINSPFGEPITNSGTKTMPTSLKAFDINVSDYKKYLRYFSFDKRLIIGFAELPEWDTDLDVSGSNPKGNKTPSVVIVLRDSTGKYTWLSELKYKEDYKRELTENPDAFAEEQEEKLISNNIQTSTQNTDFEPQHFVPSNIHIPEHSMIEKVDIIKEDQVLPKALERNLHGYNLVKELMESEIFIDNKLKEKNGSPAIDEAIYVNSPNPIDRSSITSR